MKYGRLLKGPVMLTPMEFNQQIGGDGIGFKTSESKDLMRIPARSEAQHIELMGDTGAGKTTLIMQVLRQIEERGHTAIVYDPAGEFIQRFYRPDRCDIVLNPLDQRCPYWGPSEELRSKAEAKTLAKSLYQPTDTQRDEFFTKTPQKIFAHLLRTGPTPRQLADWMANPVEIDKQVRGTEMATMIAKDSPPQRNGVLSSLGLVADSLRMLPTVEEAKGHRWCATEWAETRRGWIFITSRPTERDALQPLHSLWIDWLVLRLLSAPKEHQTPVWFVLDELASLQRLPHALLLAKLQPDQQEQALSACFKEVYNGERKPNRILLPVRNLQFWIDTNIVLALKDAPFDKRDAQLVPAAGSCVDCPKRTGHNKLLFSDIGGKLDSCTDPTCYQSKVAAHVAETIAAKPNLMQISTAYGQQKDGSTTLPRNKYTEIRADKPQDKDEAKRPEFKVCTCFPLHRPSLAGPRGRSRVPRLLRNSSTIND